MSRYSYTEEEKKKNVVLAHQEKKCQEIKEVLDSSYVEDRIAESEKLLSEFGISLPVAGSSVVVKEKRNPSKRL